MTQNPFRVEPPALVCFSTGRTSAYMLYRILDAYDGQLPEGVVVSFQNTGKEREESLRFGHEVETRWEVPIVWLEWDDVFREENYVTKDGGKSKRRRNYGPWEGFKVVSFETAARNGEPFNGEIDYYCQYREFIGAPPILPNVTARMCTANLKIKTSNRYMLSLGHQFYDASLGIRRDEPKRYHAMMAENDRANYAYTNTCPLYDAGVSKPEIMKFWGYEPITIDGEQTYLKISPGPGFDLELDPNSDEGNCDLCFLKNTTKIVRIMRKTSEFDEFWVNAEARTGQRFRKDRPGYAELREMIDSDDPETIAKLERLLRRAPKEKQIDCICGEPS